MLLLSPVVSASATTDSDGDMLADAHELQLGTDPFVVDTDGDTYGDGQEVIWLYSDPLDPNDPVPQSTNPQAWAPISIDSWTMTTKDNVGEHLTYRRPITWTVTTSLADGNYLAPDISYNYLLRYGNSSPLPTATTFADTVPTFSGYLRAGGTACAGAVAYNSTAPSEQSGWLCMTRAADDRRLSRSSGTALLKLAGLYKGTGTVMYGSYSSLSGPLVAASVKTVWIKARSVDGSATLAIRVGGQLVQRLSLQPASGWRTYAIPVGPFSGKLRIVHKPGNKVIVDAWAVAQTP